MSMTARLSLPFLAPGQAQKELFHNESLQILDALVAGAVEEPPLSSPVVSPDVGSCYIVGSSPSAEWAAYPHHIACFSDGGWRFIAPADGMTAYVRSNGMTALYRDGAWQLGTLAGSQVSIEGKKVLGSRGVAINAPNGGGTIDAEARATIGQILVAMREHGLIEI